MKLARYFLLTLTACLFLQTGCTTALKEGASAAFGPKGAYLQSETPDLGGKGTPSLRKYNSFSVGRVTVDPKFTGFGGVMPSLVVNNLEPEIIHELRKKDIPTGKSANGVTINVNLFYYEGAGAKGIIFGNVEEVLAAVTLVDNRTGQIIGRAICVGRSTSRVNLGTEKKVEGLAHGIVRWIESHYPKK